MTSVATGTNRSRRAESVRDDPVDNDGYPEGSVCAGGRVQKKTDGGKK
ncbi:MAG TPA: hypothetical protein VNQ76_12335 [Planctomicrobium sp.]|nr:hypothetical protein [Planctomicrobium sp.]